MLFYCYIILLLFYNPIMQYLPYLAATSRFASCVKGIKPVYHQQHLLPQALYHGDHYQRTRSPPHLSAVVINAAAANTKTMTSTLSHYSTPPNPHPSPQRRLRQSQCTRQNQRLLWSQGEVRNVVLIGVRNVDLGGVIGTLVPTVCTLLPVDKYGAFPHLWDTTSDCCWNILPAGY